MPYSVYILCYRDRIQNNNTTHKAVVNAPTNTISKIKCKTNKQNKFGTKWWSLWSW